MNNKINILIVLLILIILVMFIPDVAQASVFDFEDAIAVGNEPNIYIRPTDDTDVIKALNKGSRLGVFCEESPGWYRVIFGNYRGYMKKENIFLPGHDEFYGNILADSSLKTQPSFGSTSLDTVTTGSPVRITNMIGDWYKVEAPLNESEISTGYMKKQNIMQTDANDFEMFLSKGMKGDSILNLHEKLFERGFYGYINFYRDEDDEDNDGDTSEVFKFFDEYDDETVRSVKCFQYKAGLTITGIADGETLKKLYSDEDIHSIAQDKGVKDSVRMSRWWESVNYEFARGATAQVYDLGTRQYYNIQRYSGTNHADVETLTTSDTAIFKSTNEGVWNWNRLPVWVITGGATYAGSTNCQPHSPENSGIDNNGMNGQVCIHFKDSYGHGEYSEDSEHAQMVKSAYLASIDHYGMKKALEKQND